MNSGELVDVEVFEWPRALVVADNNTQNNCVSVPPNHTRVTDKHTQ